MDAGGLHSSAFWLEVYTFVGCVGLLGDFSDEIGSGSAEKWMSGSPWRTRPITTSTATPRRRLVAAREASVFKKKILCLDITKRGMHPPRGGLARGQGESLVPPYTRGSVTLSSFRCLYNHSSGRGVRAPSGVLSRGPGRNLAPPCARGSVFPFLSPSCRRSPHQCCCGGA